MHPIFYPKLQLDRDLRLQLLLISTCSQEQSINQSTNQLSINHTNLSQNVSITYHMNKSKAKYHFILTRYIKADKRFSGRERTLGLKALLHISYKKWSIKGQLGNRYVS